MTGRRQIDNGKPAVGEAHDFSRRAGREKHASRIVRPAVRNGHAHTIKQSRGEVTLESRNAAHSAAAS